MKKYILVVGGSSFISKNILYSLKNNLNFNLNDFVFILTYNKNKINGLNLNEFDCILEYIDLSKNETILDLFEKYKISFIFHLASNNSPISSNYNINDDVNFNISSLIFLLNSSVKYKIDCFYFFSTGGGFEYPKINIENYQENIYLKHNSPYSIIKQTMENYILYFNKKYSLNFVILRISNVFGLFHTSTRNGLINIAIRNALNNNPTEIYAQLDIKKDYIFSQDLATIFWNIFNKNIKNEIFNIGSGNLFSINDIELKLKTLLNNINFIKTSNSTIIENQQKFDLKKILNFEIFEATDFDQSILETLEYEKNYLK